MSLFGEELDPIDEPATGIAPSAQGLTHPRAMSFCLGHEAQEHHCLEMLAHNKMPHALLLTGLKGIGKATFAHRLAKYLLANPKGGAGDPAQDALFGAEDIPATKAENLDATPENKAVRLYVSGAHPDCKTVERAYDDAKNRYKDAVDVAEIRKIAPFLRMAASDGGWRIVIVDDADTMNRSAQNALLKILEEPPKKTLIILVAHRPGRLIATIHSRVQRLSFHPLADSHVAALLAQCETPPDEAQTAQLVAMAQGSIGNALDLWEEGGLDMLETVLACLKDYPTIDWKNIHKLTDPLTRAGQDKAYALFQQLSIKLLMEATAAKARNQSLPSYLADNQGLQKIRDKNTLPQLVQKTEDLQAHFSQSNHANLDKKQTLLHAIHLIAG